MRSVSISSSKTQQSYHRQLEATRCYSNRSRRLAAIPIHTTHQQSIYRPTPTTMSDPPPFDFQENSKAMYDDTLASPPFFIRWLVRSKLDAALKERNCGPVTEQIMYDACREVTPANQIDKVIEVLDKHKTKDVK